MDGFIVLRNDSGALMTSVNRKLLLAALAGCACLGMYACVRSNPDASRAGKVGVDSGAPPAAQRNPYDELRSTGFPGPADQALSGLPEATLTFSNPDGSRAVFTAEVASTGAQRMTGLMHRKSLATDRAMLFVFQDEAVRGFYMKNTYIPLDMVFVRGDGIVAGVVENARPLTLDSRGVDSPARFVVELNAWDAARKGIRAGSVMTASPAAVLAF